MMAIIINVKHNMVVVLNVLMGSGRFLYKDDVYAVKHWWYCMGQCNINVVVRGDCFVPVYYCTPRRFNPI